MHIGSSGLDYIRVGIIACNFFALGMMLALHVHRRYVFPFPMKLLGVSYALWALAGMSEVYVRFGKSFAWRTALEAVAAVSGLVALLWMDRRGRRLHNPGRGICDDDEG